MKFRSGEYVVHNSESTDYRFIYKITDISNSLGLNFTKIYKVTTPRGKNLEKSISYIDNHYRLLTPAEVLLYANF